MTNRFTQKAQNVLNYALRAASAMGHTYIGSAFFDERGSQPARLVIGDDFIVPELM